jgi:hypothetical protein
VSLDRGGALAAALLYEGYALYPYRASSLKNRKRFDFGVLFPRDWPGASGAEASSMRTECVVRASGSAPAARVTVRFLHLVERSEGDGQPWHEAMERQVDVPCPPLSDEVRRRATDFDFPAAETFSGTARRRRERIAGRVEVSLERDAPGVVRLAVEIVNTTPSAVSAADRDQALAHAFVSTHTLVEVEDAELVSLLDPPDELRPSVDRCRNVGTWPVLVGEPWERSTVLSSPIILYDHPRVAPESRGDLFDATEIDEILTLRTQTLTDEEKREAATDPRVRALLERTAELSEKDVARLHGALRRGPPPFAAGERVRLAPKRRADVMDIALSGRIATVVSVEQDFEGRTYLAVTVDDDPGADLGLHGQPGHRFFFHAEEVERLP